MPRRPQEPQEPALSNENGSLLVEVVQQGDQRKTLEALRDALAIAFSKAAPSEVAGIAKQLRDTTDKLEALKPPTAESPVDQIAQRRAARRAGAAVRVPAARKVVGGAGSGGAGRKRRADPGAAPKPRARGGSGRGA